MARGGRFLGRKDDGSPKFSTLGAIIGHPFYREMSKRSKKYLSKDEVKYEHPNEGKHDDDYSEKLQPETSPDLGREGDRASFESESPSIKPRMTSPLAETRRSRAPSRSYSRSQSRSQSRSHSMSKSRRESRYQMPLDDTSSDTEVPRRHARGRSVSHPSPTHFATQQPAAFLVQPPTSYLSHIPPSMSPNNVCLNPSTPSFFESPQMQSFGTVPVQSHQQPVYYQTQLAFVSTQPPVPHCIPDSTVQPVVAQSQPVTRTTPQRHPPSPAHETKSPLDPHGRPSTTETRFTTPSAIGKGTKSLSFADILEHLQTKIDEKMSELARKPGDSSLLADLRRLQEELKNKLDLAITKKTPSGDDDPEKSTREPVEDNEKGLAKSNALDDPFISQPQRGRPQIRKSSAAPEPKVCHQEESRAQRESSVERVPLRHLCLGCGCQRSSGFHDKYPLSSEKDRRKNYCGPCRKAKISRGIAERRHFCFGCGMFRSEIFQKRHSQSKGDPILPNYCGHCSVSARKCAATPETSLIGPVSRTANSRTQWLLTLLQKHRIPEEIPGGEEEERSFQAESDSMTTQVHTNCRSGHRSERHKESENTHISNEVEDGQSGDEFIAVRKKRRSQDQKRQTPAEAPPAASVKQGVSNLPEQSSDCTSRKGELNGERTQHKTPARGTVQRQRSITNEAKSTNRPYQAPCVESVPQSRRNTPPTAHQPTGNDGLQTQANSNSTQQPVDPGSEDGVDSPDVTSEGKRLTSEPSSSGSRKSSLKSTGSSSKSVRFKDPFNDQPSQPSFARYQAEVTKEGRCGGKQEKLQSEHTHKEKSPLCPRSFGGIPLAHDKNETCADGDRLQPAVANPYAIPRTQSNQGGSGSVRYGGAFSKAFDFGFDDWKEFGRRRSSFNPEYDDNSSPSGHKQGNPSPPMASIPGSSRFQETARDHREESASPDSPMFTASNHHYQGSDHKHPFSKSEHCSQWGYNPYYQPWKRYGTSHASEYNCNTRNDRGSRHWRWQRSQTWPRPGGFSSEPIIEEAGWVSSSTTKGESVLKIGMLAIYRYSDFLLTHTMTECDIVTDSSSEGVKSEEDVSEPVTSDEDDNVEDVIITEGAYNLMNGMRFGGKNSSIKGEHFPLMPEWEAGYGY
ncbi:hypothetical protein BGZ63DRAFT_400585 [Mariannaea sp. PMI_226]|nr:hypothetical protein BGZ63DRAFT_400585 [Mariannaea sp. PMI_226]